MEDRLAILESRLVQIERRLSALEGASEMGAEGQTLPPEPGLDSTFFSRTATHLGRVLLIFGGAYFLRAVTDYQFVHTALGIAMGASYALLWLFIAYRAGRVDAQRPSAAFYSVASTILALPLLVEAATRFELISGTQGAMALTVFCALALGVAVARNLRSLAWLIAAGGVATAFYLISATYTAVPEVIFLVLLAIGSLWAVYIREWKGPQWIGALGADTGVVALVLITTSDKWTVDPLNALVLGASLLVAYLASFAVRTHLLDKHIGVFEIVQGILAIGVIVFVASAASSAGRVDSLVLGVMTVVLGCGVYALAFTPATLAARGRNFFFYSTLGLGLAAAGSGILVGPDNGAAGWALLAVLLAWLSGRRNMVTLSFQCTLLLLAAAVGSGMLGTGFEALTGDAKTWPAVTGQQLIVGMATVACLFIPVAQQSTRWRRLAAIPQMAVLAVSICGVGGMLIALAAPQMTGVPGQGADLPMLATMRTAVLSFAAMTLAMSSRSPRWPEARWLVYPVLIVVGAKLLVEDFPHGHAANLFVALGLVGIAMLTVAKYTSWKKSETPAEGASGEGAPGEGTPA
jgi:hypothetical protein